jgi:hypothetical protein
VYPSPGFTGRLAREVRGKSNARSLAAKTMPQVRF